MIKRVAIVLFAVGILIAYFMNAHKGSKKDVQTINTKTEDAIQNLDEPSVAPESEESTEDDGAGAIEEGNEQSLNQWIQKGGDFNALTADGSSLLMLAIDQDCEACVQTLLKSGINIHVVNQNGQSALSSAIISGDSDLAIELLNRGANLESYTNPARYTLLMQAASTGQDKLVKVISEKHPDMVNIQDNEGMTALMYSAKEGFLSTSEILIKKGSRKDLANKKGETASVLAKKFGFTL